MTIKQQLTAELQKVLQEVGLEGVVPSVDYPSDPRHGDYATNIALVAAKNLGKNPRELAQELQAKFQELDFVEKVEIAGPGFINFWVKEEALLDEIASSSSTLRNEITGKRIAVEYTDPNPFKELHIGHLYSNIIGESLCLLFEANGATVWRADYFGDVGMHVAKSVWGLREKIKDLGFEIKDLEERSLEERVKFLGEGYALGSNKYAEDDGVKEEVKHLNKLIYIVAQKMWEEEKGLKPQVDYRQGEVIDEQELDEVYQLYVLGRKWSLEAFEVLYRRLGTKFDGYYPESIAGEKGYTLVKNNIAKGIFVESEGAVIFPGESQGLHNRVFINKLGLPTYEAKELGLPEWKYEDFTYDASYIVTANEIAPYFQVLVEALRQVHPELGKKTHPVLHGMVRLPEGKMSSRSGNVITVAGLLDEAKAKVKELVRDDVEDKEQISEMVGMAAVKYAFLKSGVGKDVTFDFNESVSFDGNSGPYIQYTYARTRSVLRKAEGTEHGAKSPKHYALSTMPEDEERQLLRLLARFPEIVEEAAERLSPNVLCTYLFELAQAFNLFYQKSPILKAADDVRALRLALTQTTGETLKKGLSLLGIKAPEKM
ncbi:MAG TPA: arginine--tRNA ligase [Patescibacteria group bacterium]|nr:arginine--tRNA ligase [Patescibacteria group bacterium]